jgi:hypothetical protein
VKKPIDISNKLIEEKKDNPVVDLGVQSDEITYVSKEKVREHIFFTIFKAIYSTKNRSGRILSNRRW